MQLYTFAFTTLISLAVADKFPLDIKLCKRSELDASNDCFKRAVQDALPLLARGIPKLKVAELSPLLVPSVTIGEGKGVVHIVQKYTNFKIYGIPEGRVDKAEISLTPKNAHIIFKFFSPEYRFEADYDMTGQILLLPATGHGRCNITGKNIEITFDTSADVVENNGKEYLHVTKCDLTLILEKLQFKFDNLFNGEKALGDQLNAVVNENWKEVYGDVKQGYEEMLETVAINYMNSFLSKLTVDELFLK